MWYQYILDIILNIPKPDEAKKDLIEFSRSFYLDNPIEQEKNHRI